MLSLAALTLASTLLVAPQPSPAEPLAVAASPRPRLRVSVASGAWTQPEIVDALLGNMILGLGGVDTTRSGHRELVLRLDGETAGWGRIGLSYAYVGWDTRLTDEGGSAGVLTNHIHAVLGHAFARWIDSEFVELYSGLGLGIGRLSGSGDVGGERRSSAATFLAWQVHALGLGVGSARLRLFAELGFGWEGLGVIGLTGRF